MSSLLLDVSSELSLLMCCSLQKVAHSTHVPNMTQIRFLGFSMLGGEDHCNISVTSSFILTVFSGSELRQCC